MKQSKLKEDIKLMK